MERYDQPLTTVDVALFTLTGGRLAVTLAPRDKAPFEGLLALPGVFVNPAWDGDLLQAAKRALDAKIGMEAPHLEQLKAFGGPARDPRGWSISIAFLGVIPEESIASASGVSFEIHPVDALPDLPFDHRTIVEAGTVRLRDQSSYSSLPAFLLPEAFTLSDLQRVYEAVLGSPLNKSAFRRKIRDVAMIEEVPGARRGGSHRPAQLYRLSQPQLARYDRVFSSRG